MATISLQTIIFFSAISQAMGASSTFLNLPRYDELFYLAAPKRIQEPNIRVKDLLSQFYNLAGRNHLDVIAYESSLSRNSENATLISRITKNVQNFLCNQVSSNISSECCRHTLTMFTAVLQQKTWALQMVDSYGKLSSGILQGSIHFTGSQDECLNADVSVQILNSGQIKTNMPFKPKYCQIGFPIEALESFSEMLPQDSIAGILVGICLPNSCKGSEIKYLIESGIHMIPFDIAQNLTMVVRCPEDLKFDDKAIFSLVIIGILLALVVFGTLIDVCVYQFAIFRQPTEYADKELPKISQVVSTQILQTKKTNNLLEFFLCFSVYKNGSKILNTTVSKGNLTSIHGIRFISMMWVILGHTYIFGISVWRNMATLLSLFKRFTFQVISNALFSVDTFFMLSGLLVTYGIMKAMKKQNNKHNWVYFYAHRFWRLTPPYMLVMMVYIPLFQYWGDGPYWPQTGIEINYCKDTWWYNLLYINNFLTDISKGMCMAWTWYLSNDMQFYVISPLILIPLYKKPKLGGLILLVLLLAHFISSGVISTVNGFGPNMFGTSGTPVDYFKDIYIKPYTRIGPYLIGMMYGYLLHQNNCKVYINKYIVAVIWLFASVCAVSVLFGLYDYNRGDAMSQELSSLYTALARTVWALSVGWVIYACSTGYGGFVNTILSWKAFIPLSRLTYCAYLVHPIILQSFYLSQRYTIYITDFEIMYLFFGNVMLSFAVAFVVSMTFEAPMILLESLILGKNKKSNT